MASLFRSRTTIRPEGWCYLVVMAFILAGALLREINLLVVMFGLMTGPLLFNRLVVRSILHRVEVRRKLPATVTAGELLVAEIQVRNPQANPCWSLVVEDEFHPEKPQPDVPRIKGRALAVYVPPRQQRKVSYQGRIPRRGRYRVGPSRIWTRFPLGLVQQLRVLKNPATLVVYPRPGHLTPQWHRLFVGRVQGVRRAQQQRRVSDGDFHSLRGWRPGDSHRLIHWRTSARQGELMVRQFEQLPGRDLALVLDLWLPPRAAVSQRECVERVVSFAASVAANVSRRGNCQFLLGLAGDEPHLLRGAASLGLLEEILHRLAVTEASPVTAADRVLGEVLDQSRAGTSVVLVSTRPIDLAGEMYRGVWQQPRRVAWRETIHCLDASRGDLEPYFLEEPGDPPR